MLTLTKATICACSAWAASASVLSAPDYSAQADEIRNLMEGVRQQSGGSTPARHVEAAAVTMDPTEHFPGLDDQLFKRADQVEADLLAMDAPSVGRRTALAAQSQDQSSRHLRAARFFATHGMGNIGHLLGEELSASESAEATREEAEAHNKLEAMGAAPADKVVLKTDSSLRGSTGTSMSDFDAEEPSSVKQPSP
eukprot:TRINITY_DN8204_c0_g1_i2.p1 TRINITY_DN8204_c0_g1~~TRINITY_DN8204_c0_g1_i2.p1  ORF type:complete len:196 (-),score=36.71 TRINITY_DN8204_c0_g1_i2:143-730(-)